MPFTRTKLPGFSAAVSSPLSEGSRNSLTFIVSVKSVMLMITRFRSRPFFVWISLTSTAEICPLTVTSPIAPRIVFISTVSSSKSFPYITSGLSDQLSACARLSSPLPAPLPRPAFPFTDPLRPAFFTGRLPETSPAVSVPVFFSVFLSFSSPACSCSFSGTFVPAKKLPAPAATFSSTCIWRKARVFSATDAFL